LPQGGILVFLTGKNEIIRMVNRLRKALNGKAKLQQNRYTGSDDVTIPNSLINDDVGLRELDDEELDAEDADVDDYEELQEDDGDIEPIRTGETDGNVPEHAYILPLYSLLSTEEQAKVFAPVPEGHRLIVLATNIAETSITLPGVSYVVDTGRQKCRNYSSGTGVASYDVMWISKAAAGE
jgi:ATP-dependent RNA helicase DHX37/DHR1